MQLFMHPLVRMSFIFYSPKRPNLNSRYICLKHRQNHFTPILSTFYKENATHFSIPKAYLRSSNWLLQQRSVLYFQPKFSLLVMSLGYFLQADQKKKIRVDKNLYIYYKWVYHIKEAYIPCLIFFSVSSVTKQHKILKRFYLFPAKNNWLSIVMEHKGHSCNLICNLSWNLINTLLYLNFVLRKSGEYNFSHCVKHRAYLAKAKSYFFLI